MLIPEEGCIIALTHCQGGMAPLAFLSQNSPAVTVSEEVLRHGNMELRIVVLADVFKHWRKCHHLCLPVLLILGEFIGTLGNQIQVT